MKLLGFLKKNKEKKKQLLDLNGNILQEGNEVEAQRYDMGRSRLIIVEDQFYYESLETGKRVLWVKMIDAITERQKVKKISED